MVKSLMVLRWHGAKIILQERRTDANHVVLNGIQRRE